MPTDKQPIDPPFPAVSADAVALALPHAVQQAKEAYRSGNWAEAERLCRLIVNQQQDNFDALNVLGIISAQTQRSQQAIALLSRAIAVNPNRLSTPCDFANLLHDLKCCQEAHWNLSLCHLQLGEFARGWEEYEWRWGVDQFGISRPDATQPPWLGAEPLSGKTILLHSEQGLGDTLQFCRYAPQVSALGATVILEVQPPLLSLLAGLEGAAQVLPKGVTLPAFDYHCPLLSLPLAFKTELSTIPATVPYIRSDAARVASWRQRLGAKTKPRVGVVWSGGTVHINDRHRSLALSEVLSLATDWTETISLQKEVRASDAALLAQRSDIRHFGMYLADFADTAGLVSLMDIVVTVDTSVAHLAGAMGKQVWVLLPHNSDWRWLLAREDSPWYPTMRLFRQITLGDWRSVIDRVHKELLQQRVTLYAAAATAASGGPDQPLEVRSSIQKPISETVRNPAASTKPADVAPTVMISTQQAVAALQRGDWAEAERLCRVILREQSDCFDALYMLGVISAQTQRPQEAFDLFSRAVSANPGRADLHSNLGSVLHSLHRHEEALESCNQALRIKPDFAEALYNRGIVLGELKRHEEAIESFELALRIKPEYVDALNSRGAVLRTLNRPGDALESYDRALKIKPDYAEAWNSRGCVLDDLKRAEEALQSYARALQLKPGYAEALNNHSKTLRALKRNAKV